MQFKLSIATVLLALTSSTIAILPPRPTHFPPPFWSNPRLNDGRIRPAVCSSNRNSALYCGPRYAGSGYDKRAPVWAGPDGKFKDGMIRPAVCSSNPNSPLYCPGVRTAYNHKRSPQFNIQVCTPDPSGQRHCLENYRSDRWRLTRPQQKRSPQFRAQVCTPDPTGQRRCLENRIRPSPIWDLFKQPIGTISHGVGKRSQVMPTTSLDRIREMYRQQAIRSRCRHLWGTKKYAECHRGSQKRHHYGKSKNKKPRMMVCSFDKKNPNYCPGLEKDTEKVDERKGGRKSFFA